MKLRNFGLSLILLAGSNLSASVYTYTVNLTGPGESPTNTSPGVGFAFLSFNDVTDLLTLQMSFSGLLGTTTASHIHCCTPTPFAGTAGVATQTPTFVNFPLGVTSGTYSNTFDMSLASSYNPAFVTANGGSVPNALSVLGTGVGANEAYLNIHTTAFPGGEIRGFLVATPEPATVGLVGLALAGLLAIAYRRRNAQSLVP